MKWDNIRIFLEKTKEIQQIGIGNIVGKAIIGIFWLYMATVLGTEDYGQVNYLIALGSMGAAISMVGTSNTIIVYVAKKIPIESTVYTIALILGLVASIVIFIIFNNIIAGIFVFGYIFYNLGIADLLGKKQYKKYSLVLIFQKIIFALLGFFLYHIIGWEGVVLGFALSMLIFSPIVLRGFRDTKINFKILKPRFGFMMNNYTLTVEKIFSSQLDKLLIAPMFGFSILGNYALSIQILSIMSMLPSIVFQYTLSQDATGKSNLTIKKLSIISSILISVLGIILSPIIIPIIYPEFIESVYLIQIVSLQIIPASIVLTFTSKFLGEEKSKYVLVGQGISVLIYLGGLLSLGNLLGITGVAISLVLSSTCQAIFYLIINIKNRSNEK